jgi:hypothetical protein
MRLRMRRIVELKKGFKKEDNFFKKKKNFLKKKEIHVFRV